MWPQETKEYKTKNKEIKNNMKTYKLFSEECHFLAANNLLKLLLWLVKQDLRRLILFGKKKNKPNLQELMNF